MGVFEVEKIYTSAKADEVCIKDLCDARDSRVFDYAIDCAMKLKRVKNKISKRLVKKITDYKSRLNSDNANEFYDTFYNDVESDYKFFFQVVMEDLKKMYSKA